MSRFGSVTLGLFSAAMLVASCARDTGITSVIKEPAGESKGTFVFLTGDGYEPAQFDTILNTVSENGWRVVASAVEGDEAVQFLSSQLNEENCVVFAGFGSGAAPAVDVAVENREAGADGIITISGLMNPESDFKYTTIKGATIAAEHDQIVTQLMIHGQAKEFPPMSEFLTIRGGNRSGFMNDVVIEGDGEATLTGEEQRTITADILSNLLTDWCQAFQPEEEDERAPEGVSLGITVEAPANAEDAGEDTQPEQP